MLRTIVSAISFSCIQLLHYITFTRAVVCLWHAVAERTETFDDTISGIETTFCTVETRLLTQVESCKGTWNNVSAISTTLIICTSSAHHQASNLLILLVTLTQHRNSSIGNSMSKFSLLIYSVIMTPPNLKVCVHDKIQVFNLCEIESSKDW